MKNDEKKPMKSVFDSFGNFLQWDELDTESDDWIESQNEQQNDFKNGGSSLEKAALLARLIGSFSFFVGVVIFLIWLFT